MTTFGGHPLSCAAGLAALEVLLRDRLVERARRARRAICAGGSARSPDAAASRRSAASACSSASSSTTPAACARFARRAWERGLILNWTLHRDTVVRLAPPLVLTDDEAAEAVARITTALD